jgi:HEAT repeat protein
MKKLFLTSLGCAGLLALLPQTGYAHGGQYRGPGDVVPPNPGGGRGSGPAGPSAPGPGGPSTPGPGGPAGPGPSAPATGGPAGPSGSRGPTTGGRGVQLDDDLTQWVYWWEFNKDPFIRLKDSIHSNTAVSGSDEFFLGATRKVDSRDSMAPSEDEKLNVILPALKKAIDSTENHDISSSCMVAMAKVGRNHDPDFKLRDVFLPRLKSHTQEISETAALSFGIAALKDADNLDTLIDLAKDTANGRQICDKPEVNDRTRSFAAYGLGLVAYANADVEFKTKAFEALRTLVDDDKVTSRNIKVAALNAIGLLNPSATDEKGKQLLTDALKCLDGYYQKPLGAGEQLMQAHVPPAVAKLLGKNFPDEKVVEDWKKSFVDDLTEKGKQKRTSHDISRSCVLALGQLCKPVDDDKAKDAAICKMLLDQWKEHKDPQTRYFSMLALGQIGGKLNHETLLKEFDKAGKSLEKPWVAMAMGVYAFNKYEAQKEAKQSPEIEEEFGRTLMPALEDVKDPGAQSAFAVALGLCQYKAAADDLRSMLTHSAKNKDDLAGYICIGLALMGDERSKDEINNLVAGALRRPDLLKQGAIALGKLGDKNVAENLQKLLSQDSTLATLSAIASALGFIGDRRSIEPLKQMLANEQLTELTRAFAAVALGGVGDKEKLPWNSKIGTNMNYRAAVETLTDKSAGILDIL